MPGQRLRPDALLNGLEFDFPDNRGRSRIHRITLYAHDTQGPVLTLYGHQKAQFNNESFRDNILVAGRIKAVYVEGDSVEHVTIHSLRDAPDGHGHENSSNAGPHAHVQVRKTEYPDDASLEQALVDIIFKLPPLSLLDPADAPACTMYFKDNGWA